jgi:dihydroflavonol-4-reductase
VRRFLRRRLPVYIDGAINVVDVRDVARGHMLADEAGHEGERYILAGRNFTLQRFFADLSRISGVPPPPVRLPGTAVLGAVQLLEHFGLPAPGSADEVRSGMQWWTYRNEKARRELGFQPRPHEETLEDTVRWLQERIDGGSEVDRLADLAMRAAGAAARLTRTMPLIGEGRR